MRVSTNQLYNRSLHGFQTQQSTIAHIQEQLASGKKNLRPSDDPAEVARSLELQQIVDRTTQYTDNINGADSRLKMEETTLGSVHENLLRVRDLAVQGSSTTLSQDARNALVVELRERISQIASLANTVDPYGDYIFAGNKGKTLPFVERSVAGYQRIEYVGDQTSRRVQVSESDLVESGDTGSDVFMKIPSNYAVHGVADLTNTGSGNIAPVFRTDASLATGNNYRIQFTGATTYDIINDTTATTVSTGNTYVSGQAIEFDGLRTTIEGTPANGDAFRIRDGQYQDIFTTLNKMVIALEAGAANTADRTRLNSAMQESLEDVDKALVKVNEIRAKIGGRMNVMESYRSQHEAHIVDTKSTISLLQDVDYAEAATQLQKNLLSLQAAQQSFARVQSNSLFNFL